MTECRYYICLTRTSSHFGKAFSYFLILFTIEAFFLNELVQAQEIQLPYKMPSFFITPADAYKINLEANQQFGVLGDGKWTTIDRIYSTERFQNAMYFIVTSNKTDLFQGSLDQISDYYDYLAKHPVVLDNDLRWPALASKTVFVISLGELALPILDSVFDLFSVERLSDVAKNFLNGTASATVVADVTEKAFGPLLRNEIKIDDSFRFDAETLYREQFNPQVLDFYNRFTDYDQLFINSALIRFYATEEVESALDANLLNPEERVYWGLRKMGYSNEKIVDYLESKKK